MGVIAGFFSGEMGNAVTEEVLWAGSLGGSSALCHTAFLNATFETVLEINSEVSLCGKY